MKCPYCDNEMPGYPQFCQKCGCILTQNVNQNAILKSYWSSVETGIPYVYHEKRDIVQEEKTKKKERRRKKVKRIVVTVCILGGALGFCYVLFVTIPEMNLKKATELYNNKQYEDALELLEDISPYRDVEEMINLCNEHIEEVEYQEDVTE